MQINISFREQKPKKKTEEPVSFSTLIACNSCSMCWSCNLLLPQEFVDVDIYLLDICLCCYRRKKRQSILCTGFFFLMSRWGQVECGESTESTRILSLTPKEQHHSFKRRGHRVDPQRDSLLLAVSMSCSP